MNRENEVAETMDIDFKLPVLFAKSPKSPLGLKKVTRLNVLI